MQGQCDCGAVTVTLSTRPEEINACQCNYCRRIGARWAYPETSTVSIQGETAIYKRGSRFASFHRCVQCGVVTHWDSDGKRPYMGVNTSNFGPDLLTDIPVEFRS